VPHAKPHAFCCWPQGHKFLRLPDLERTQEWTESAEGQSRRFEPALLTSAVSPKADIRLHRNI
jgi:hypothetical protein